MDTNEKKRGENPQAAEKRREERPAPRAKSAPPRKTPAEKKPVKPAAQKNEAETLRKKSAPAAGEAARKKPAPSAGEATRKKSAPSGGETTRRKPAPSGTEENRKPAQTPDRSSQTAEEVYHPKQDGRRRPASENPPERPAKKTAPKKKKEPEDTGYQPYKAANQRKKAQQASAVKKFFSSQNPILKKINDRDAFAEDSDNARKRKAEAAKKKKQSPFSAPAVVYTDPLPFNRDRLLVQLITVVAVVLALVLGMSVFFKVKTITISGAEVYSPWTIQEASGIKQGDNLLTFGRARASGQITANLPYVKSVRIGIKLPDTVNIEIEEESVVYAIKSEEGIWWLMNSNGKVVSMSNNSEAKNYTQVVGVTLTAPQVNEPGVATEAVPTETSEDGEFIPVLITGAQRLEAALQILKALEANDIVGEAASVDVSRLDDIILWYGTRFQVNLGDTSQLENKIAFMYDAILQMSEYDTGVLDISFTIWPDQIGYTPFQ